MYFPVIINGLDYLHSSVSSLVGEPKGRALKYAVLHLQFAAETLFKARLELHDAALVWVKREKFDERLHRLGDFKSVGTKDALERLRDEGGSRTRSPQTTVPSRPWSICATV
ncbi:hypothetical protein [Streptomyces sp. NPDC005141]